jgi:5'-3' exonuclease
MVQPKVLYLVVDGVAPPRQDESTALRRFRSAKEAEVTASEIIARSKGGVLPDELKRQETVR